ncbi:MAG: riboflavin synthase [Victivallaceae bacterium]
MFTGLVETTAEITNRNISGGSGKLRLRPDKPFKGLVFGESIAVNGACLTLEREHTDGTLEFHALEETLKRTNLGGIKIGGKVNLERALRLGDRLGGHLVTGHIDITSPLISLKKTGADYELRIAMPETLKPFFVPKGSIAIDGVSLTLVDVTDESFSVHLIPVTLDATALRDRKPGDAVNLEADLLGKYVQRQLSLITGNSCKSNVTMELLAKAGW